MSVLKFPHLFEPLVIGNTVFRNRIFASPQGSSYLDVNEFPTPEVTVFYERKAIGGAATTCMGVRNVDPVSGLNWGDNVIDLKSHRGISWFSSVCAYNALASGTFSITATPAFSAT